MHLFLATATLLAGPLLTNCYQPSALREVHAWKFVDFTYADEAARQEALRSGVFRRNATLPLGIERWRDKVFVTIPRRKAGVPVTLGYIRADDTERSPLVTPYPDWETNSYRQEGESQDTNHITSTYRVRADECNRLWVIDSGLADTGSGVFKKVTSPQILIYDLISDKLLLSYFLPESDIKTDSFFANVAVDVTPDTCDDAFAYLPDLGGFGLVVFSLRSKSSWRVDHHYFHFDPRAGDYNIAGIDFQWTDGVFSAALSEVKNDGFRRLYFHPLSSYREFSVSTRVLRDKSLSSKSFRQFSDEGSRGLNSQATGSFYDEGSGVLFFMEIQRHAITCWNTRVPLRPENLGVVAASPISDSFIYPSDVKVDSEGTLWAITNNLPVYIYKEVDTSKYNYFIFKASAQQAIQGTVCEKQQSKGRGLVPVLIPSFGLRALSFHGHGY